MDILLTGLLHDSSSSRQQTVTEGTLCGRNALYITCISPVPVGIYLHSCEILASHSSATRLLKRCSDHEY